MLYLPVGIPGCGKSYFGAKHFIDDEIVCPDTYRRILTGSVANQDANSTVFDICHKITHFRLKHGQVVYFDATNLRRADRRKLLAIAESHGVKTIAILFPLDYDLAMEQNKMRDAVVPDFVMERMRDRAETISIKSLEEEGFIVMEPEDF